MKAAGFFRLAETYPEREVLIDAAGQWASAGDVLANMNRLAHGLHHLGLESGDTLAVVLSNRREFIECYGAAIQSGLFFVAVNWHLVPSEISYLLDDSKAKAVITESRFGDVVCDAIREASVPEEVAFAIDGHERLRPLAELAGGQPADPPHRRSPGQIMFYTSGTTGRPKGVHKKFRAEPSDELTLISGIGPIRRAMRATDAPAAGEASDLTFLSSGPLYHGLPISGAVGALDAGGTVVVMDKWTPEGFLELVQKHRVTDTTVVPTMFHRLLALPDAVRSNADVSSLRHVNHGGSPCPLEVKRRMIDWWGPIITESYSSTEGAGTTVTAQEWLAKPGTVGRPSPGVTIKVLDPDGNECSPGEPGLVYMTPSLWEFEYHHDADKTKRARQGSLFTVGDIGYLDKDGYLFLCDRQADTIISGGVNIYPAEVEAALLEHPAVGDAAVVGVPNPEWGEEVRALVELRDPSTGSAGLEDELIQFCRVRIAHFKCPKAVDFVESLSRDPSGKLRRGAIRAKYWQESVKRI